MFIKRTAQNRFTQSKADVTYSVGLDYSTIQLHGVRTTLTSQISLKYKKICSVTRNRISGSTCMSTETDHKARGGRQAEKEIEGKEVSAVPSRRAGELNDRHPSSVAGHRF